MPQAGLLFVHNMYLDKQTTRWGFKVQSKQNIHLPSATCLLHASTTPPVSPQFQKHALLWGIDRAKKWVTKCSKLLKASSNWLSFKLDLTFRDVCFGPKKDVYGNEKYGQRGSQWRLFKRQTMMEAIWAKATASPIHLIHLILTVREIWARPSDHEVVDLIQ